MTQENKDRLAASVQGFRLPRYQEIPTVGLYLEQTAKYISEILSPLEENCMTSSMISNYVKKKLIASPVKKQYSRDQIVYLFFVAVAKGRRRNHLPAPRSLEHPTLDVFAKIDAIIFVHCFE